MNNELIKKTKKALEYLNDYKECLEYAQDKCDKLGCGYSHLIPDNNDYIENQIEDFEYIKNNELDLEKIINEYSSYIATIINNMARDNLNNEDKEEIISEVFFILWKNMNKLNINKYLSSYIAGITRNVVKEYLRKIKVNFDISDYENSLYSYDKIDLLDNSIEEISKIEKKLKNMKEIDKKVFLDFYYSSKSTYFS